MLNAALRFLMLLAGVGFVASLIVHVAAWLGSDLGLGESAMLLHLGIFVVFVPAVLVSRSSSTREKKSLKAFFRGCPPWVEPVMNGLLVYVIVNFFLFTVQTIQLDKQHVPPTLETRGVSGHWLGFYAWAFAMLWSRLKAGPLESKCVNGHTVGYGDKFCPECGAGLGAAGQASPLSSSRSTVSQSN